MQGLVLKSTGKWYSILLPSGEIISAGIKGKLRLDGLKTTNPVAAGDRVLLEKREFHYEDESSELLFVRLYREKITSYVSPLT